VAYSFFAGLDRYRLALLAAGAGEVHVAGAGPVLFAIAEDRAGGLGIVEKLKRERIECYLAGTLS
jgi:homoserine kinase